MYIWDPDPALPLGGRINLAVVALPRLNLNGRDVIALDGEFARVRNGGQMNARNAETNPVTAVSLGDAAPDCHGNFLFEPGRGGGRMDLVQMPDEGFAQRYIQASHFGEVNTYFHLDQIAKYINGLLKELNAPRLPPVIAVVNAHHAASQLSGIIDGIRRKERCVAFQGGHYRLPSRRYNIREPRALSRWGEIHLGPGRQLTCEGALTDATGPRYRCNASHNAGIIYHEYGHHVTRHTADFRANELRGPFRQSNRKTALDEGIADYWSAAMLQTPHIWAWHRRHDSQKMHPRSLASKKTMADFDYSATADAHANGTIFAAALWDCRCQLEIIQGNPRFVDLLLLKAMLHLRGRLNGKDNRSGRTEVSFPLALSALLHADSTLSNGTFTNLVRSSFAKRGMTPETS